MRVSRVPSQLPARPLGTGWEFSLDFSQEESQDVSLECSWILPGTDVIHVSNTMKGVAS